MYLDEVMKSLKAGKPTDDLIERWKKEIKKRLDLSMFKDYPEEDKEDLGSYAMLMLLKNWKSFNPAKSNNPHAYFSICIHSAVIQELSINRRQNQITKSITPKNKSIRAQLGVKTLDKDAIIRSVLRRMRDGYDSKELLSSITAAQKAGLNFPEFKIIKKSLKNEVRIAS